MEELRRIFKLQKVMFQIKKARRLNYISQMTLKFHKLATRLFIWSVGREVTQYQNLYNLTGDFRWAKFTIEMKNMLIRMKEELPDESNSDDKRGTK